MTIELTPKSLKNIEQLRRKFRVSNEQLIEMALQEFSQAQQDWDAILATDPVNNDLTEEEAVQLALSEVRAHRSTKR
jgi:hypothetical protein